MSTTKISVIIPVYNTDKYVEKCINSVLNQTLKDIEIIIVNDGSTDNSLEKIKKYEKDKRVKIINKKNEGLSKTRNIGLKIATGKYIYHMDSDDYLESNKVLEKLYLDSEKNNLDILVFDFYKEIQKEKEYCVNLDVVNTENIILKEEYIKDLIKAKWGMNIWSKLVKRELFTKNNILFPENIFLGEDLLVSLKLVYFAKKIGKLNEALYNYVQHDFQGTKTIKKEKEYSDLYKLYIEIERFLKKEKVFYKFENEFYNRMFKMCKTVLKPKNKKSEIYNIIKKYFIENKKELLNSDEYKNLSFFNKCKFHIRKEFFY